MSRIPATDRVSKYPFPRNLLVAPATIARRLTLAVFALVSLLLVSGAYAPAEAFEPETLELTGTVRDFRGSHPDMQFRGGVDQGIVEPLLGADGKPVYTTTRSSTPTTNGKQFFDQWYRDVAGVNRSQALTIPLTNSAGRPDIFTFDSSGFFPIDGELFGNEGMVHNYYFTFELHSRFTYRGGEVFSFRGDDDVFVFVNGHRVIDLGGVHGPMADQVSLDAVASSIGLEIGGTYDLDFFFAERHCCGSNFRMQTSIALEQPPENPAPEALCRDVAVEVSQTCAAAASIDAGSSDPDGEPVTLTQEPAGPYPVGDTQVTLTVADEGGRTDTCRATVTVIDVASPIVECAAPATITPPDAPIAFTGTATDNCTVANLSAHGPDCFMHTKKGKRIDKTESCEVTVDGATLTVLDSGGVGDHITWSVTATDGSGNEITRRCEVEVVNPGRGR